MISKNSIRLAGLVLFPGICLLIAWPPIGIVLPIFVFLVPLLIISWDNSIHSLYRLLSVFISVYLCSSTQTFWLAEIALTGAIIAWLVNSILLTLPFLWIIYGRRSIFTLLMFLTQWIIGEFIQLTAGFGFPAMLLGNALSAIDQFIYWYSVTGVLGGTLWILIINIIIFLLVISLFKTHKMAISLLVVIVVPVITSFIMEKRISKNVVTGLIVHPNVNCYTEKYVKTNVQLLEEYISLIKSSNLDGVDFVTLPETAITDLGWVNDIPNHYLLKLISTEFVSYPNITIISGAVVYSRSSEKSLDSFYSENLKAYLRAYNSAVSINFGDNSIAIRHKEKRVPFEEYQPYPLLGKLINFIHPPVMNKIFATESLQNQIFKVGNTSLFVPICYEILFGNFLAERAGDARAICFIMNEGWYDKLWASNQFWEICRLRSIELGKSILVSSSC